MFRVLNVVYSVLFMLVYTPLWAQEGPTETEEKPSQKKRVEKSEKVEKEADGTQATRDWGSSSIESSYEYEGKPLEVDPD